MREGTQDMDTPRCVGFIALVSAHWFQRIIQQKFGGVGSGKGKMFASFFYRYVFM